MKAGLTGPDLSVHRNGRSQFLFIILLMAAYCIGNSLNLVLNLGIWKGAEKLVSSDSGQYLAFAERFLSGNFSMDYIRNVPHRQPLYPILLAAATKIGNGNLFFLGEISVIAITLAIGSVYFGIFRFFKVILLRQLQHSASPVILSCGEPLVPAC